jgi:MinD superfamily P-loop ATPase
LILAIASGKGGTGKTTVAVNLARVHGGRPTLLDCDVEEPNAHLFLEGRPAGSEIVSIPVPVVDEALCDGCGECSRFCATHAIVSFGTTPLVFPELCHGCGGCTMVCPRQAIHEAGKRIGIVERFRADNITLIHGRLDVGAPMAPPLIRAVKAAPRDGEITILDAPPGTSCPVFTSVRDSDFVLLITEPTPFGLSDLKLAVDMTRELRIPFAVAINKYGSGDNRVHAFCREKGIPILAEIPDDRRIAEAYSVGKLIVDVLPEIRGLFLDLLEKLKDPASRRSPQYAGS